MDCPFTSTLGFLRLPLCWLLTLAKYGHAIEVWMGIPGWEAWFSTPDLVTNQIFEAILFLVIFGTVGLLLLTHRMGLGPRDWKPPVRLTTAMPIAMWLEVCVVRALFRLARFISRSS